MTGKTRTLIVSASLAGALLTGALATPRPALAQKAPQQMAQVGNTQRPPDAPAPTVPGPRPGENLSDQLRRNDGVIPPAQNLDPDMRKPAPETGTTPVIPPPGTPGGDNSLQPK